MNTETETTPAREQWECGEMEKINQHRYVIPIFSDDGFEVAIAKGKTPEGAQLNAARIIATNEARATKKGQP